MTDAELRDQAVALLQRTTDSYPAWVRKGRPAASNWAKALALLAQIAQPPAPAPITNPVPPPATGVLFGAYLEGAQTFGHYYPAEAPWGNGPDTRTWDRFERDAGRRLDMLMLGQPSFFSRPFDYDGLIFAASSRAIPVVDVDTSQTGTLAEFAAGAHDATVTAVAKAIAQRALQRPFVLRVNAEMNGHWYRYGVEAQADPGVFVAAWCRIHDLFTAAGVTAVSWHWCPNVDVLDPTPKLTPLEQLYPGDAYVDWAGMTGYRHAADESVDWIFADTYRRLTALTRKPIMVGEVGSVDSTPNEGSKAEFIETFFARLPMWPQIRALCWFNWRIDENGQTWDWPIESSPAALAAFRAAVASTYIAGRP